MNGELSSMREMFRLAAEFGTARTVRATVGVGVRNIRRRPECNRHSRTLLCVLHFSAKVAWI